MNGNYKYGLRFPREVCDQASVVQCSSHHPCLAGIGGKGATNICVPFNLWQNPLQGLLYLSSPLVNVHEDKHGVVLYPLTLFLLNEMESIK